MNSRPGLRAKMIAGVRSYYADPVNADPVNRAAHIKRCRETQERIKHLPHIREARKRAGRELGSKNIHLTRSPESRAKAGRSISATKLAHIPEAARDLYQALKKTGLSAAERAEIAIKSAQQAAARDVARASAAGRAKHAREKAQAY